MYVLYICKMYNKLRCAGIHSQNGLLDHLVCSHVR